jgi:polyferredoxin
MSPSTASLVLRRHNPAVVGRGVYCGWLCPFGALQEPVLIASRRLRLPEIEFSDAEKDVDLLRKVKAPAERRGHPVRRR